MSLFICSLSLCVFLHACALPSLCLFFSFCVTFGRVPLWCSGHEMTLCVAILILHCAAAVQFPRHLETAVTCLAGVWLCISEREQWLRLGPSAAYCQEACHGEHPLSAPFLLIMHSWDRQYKLHLNLCQGKSIHFHRITPLPAYGTGFSVRQAKWKAMCLDPSGDGCSNQTKALGLKQVQDFAYCYGESSLASRAFLDSWGWAWSPTPWDLICPFGQDSVS